MVVYQRGIKSLGLSNSIILTIWWKDLHVMYTAKTIFTFLCIKGKFSKPFIQEMAFLSAWYRIASVSIDMIVSTIWWKDLHCTMLKRAVPFYV